MLFRRKTPISNKSREAIVRMNRLQAFISTLSSVRARQKGAQSVHAPVQPCIVPDETLSTPSSSRSNGTSRSSSLKTIRQPDASILLPPEFKSTCERHEDLHQDNHLRQKHTMQCMIPLASDTSHNSSSNNNIKHNDNDNDNESDNDNDSSSGNGTHKDAVVTSAITSRPESAIYASTQNESHLYDPPSYRQTGLRGNLPTRARSMFRPFDKELKAMTLWRDAVAQQWQPSSGLDIDKKPSGSPAKNLATSKFIINEIYTTEKTYHSLLKLFQMRYMEPMLAASQEKDPLVRSGDIPVLFGHLPKLVSISEKILAHFSSQSRKDLKPCDVADIFRHIENELVVFLRYAMHYKSQAKTIRRACNNVLFVKLDQETQTRRETNRMGMADFFIAPIQRVPRYCLLLKDLLRHIPASSPDTKNLDIALKTMTGLATAMDLMQKSKTNPKQTPRTMHIPTVKMINA